ncbi:MAG TPA: UDP-3-O-(3-hydroxymyristoyl)glucosamine N-acyltransferase [Phycisphaerae bacterium]|nr:UDP-3-O-(3-hydroxymyristoyl)glucosamine N-acyltransferase [Phycisphaerae bacterium]HNU46972.1 UDP-3-O-(3-hydroxymyristoyl)glucosamine N-acyltransferase [Phycisphaerae bacterium]
MRLSQLIEVLAGHGLKARLDGEDRLIRAVNTLEDAGPGELSFLSNPKYLSAVKDTKASAVVLKDGITVPAGISALRCADPYAALTVAIIAIHGHRQHPQWGVSKAAGIHPTARVGPDANIAHGVTIGAGVAIGARCAIYPGCYVADGAQLGDDCTLYPNVVIYDHCVLGSRVTIHAGSVIGEDGLGYAPVEGHWLKIPQVGRVIIGDDVEIGANCAIDRATLGRTQIGTGTKFGNVIVIGHGTKIGPHCLFVGLVGVAGSVTVGQHVTVAGQVGMAGHLHVGDDATIGAQAGVAGDVPAGATYLGSPAIDTDAAKRSMIAVQKLPDWMKRVKELERQVRELRGRLDELHQK